MIVSFSSTNSKKYGVSSAIVLEYLQSFLAYREIPLALDTVLDWGKTWSTQSNIKRTLTTLEKKGLITIANQLGCDRVLLTSVIKSVQPTLIDIQEEEKPRSPVHLMNEAIIEITKTNTKLVAYTRYMRYAKSLVEADYTADELLLWYGEGGWWYTEHWKGQRAAPPTQNDISQTIISAKEHKVFKQQEESSGFWSRK